VKFAIVGTRGIPARYGGFETFAEELSTRLAARGHNVTVYCRERYTAGTYRGVRLRYLPTIRHKYLDTIVHTFFSTLDLALMPKQDAVLYCNAANAIFTWLPRLRGMRVALNVDGLPLIKPPYGTISAINLDRGEIVWQIAHGETPDVVRNHPALKGLNIPRTGQTGYNVGTLITKTLVIAGDGQVTTTASHPRGAMLRAYDKANGKEVGAVYMPAPETGSPMTYMLNGKQYIVIAVSGGPYSGEYIAFTLPADDTTRAQIGR